MKALLKAFGFNGSLKFPYDALLGWDMWVLDSGGVETKVNQDDQVEIWGL